MQFRLSLQRLSVGVLLSLGLSACDSRQSEPKQQPQPKQQAQQIPNATTAEEQAKSLTDVAGQATLPYSTAQKNHLAPPSEADLIYVGRYHGRIPCTDPFAGCAQGETEAEYIVNLLADGSVYWTNTSFGRISSDSTHNISKIEQTCKQVQWSVLRAFSEIVLRCDAADVSLYYQIDKNKNLVLNRERIWNTDNGANRKFFAEYPFPEQSYVIEKVK